eukprot:m.484585 g.484585  ORF g.484585 m.484585 type:complete len:130 (-) comp57202_c0_seq21:637-1026(-)
MHRLVPTAREPDSPRLSVVVPGKDELEEFLELLELTKYAHHFRREDIDFETLLTMDENDLKSIGIDLFGPRRKISSAIKQCVQCSFQDNHNRRSFVTPPAESFSNAPATLPSRHPHRRVQSLRSPKLPH